MDDWMTNECGVDDVRKAGTTNTEKAGPSAILPTAIPYDLI
jgi:hypothetical protein